MTDSKGHILAQHQDVGGKGKFTFVTEVYDMFEVCFVSRVPQRKFESLNNSLNPILWFLSFYIKLLY